MTASMKNDLLSVSTFRPSVENVMLLLILLALIVLFSILSPFFLTLQNISNILLSVSVIGVMAAVSTLVVVGRELDLSLGSFTALLSVVVVMLVDVIGWPWPLGVAATLLIGALCGSVNGLIVSWLGINSIITTIGTLSVFRGITFMLTDGQTLAVSNEALMFFGFGRIAGVPISVWLFAFAVIATHFVASRTVIGRAIFAVGANPRAALVAGLPVKRIRFWLFVASGVSAAVAALLLVGQTGIATPNGAVGYELLVVTAILIGGTSLTGGEGSVVKTAIGVLIIGVLSNGMVLLSVPTFYQITAQGLLMLAAVILDQIRSKGAMDVH